VVIDEMVGVWTTLLAVPAGHLWYAIAAFVLFRFLDIVKPMGVRLMEKMRGGTGVMMDDVLAGIYGFMVLYVVQNIIVPLWD
jgi:phosphatidylglycerophosphatase A